MVSIEVAETQDSDLIPVFYLVVLTFIDDCFIRLDFNHVAFGMFV